MTKVSRMNEKTFELLNKYRDTMETKKWNGKRFNSIIKSIRSGIIYHCSIDEWLEIGDNDSHSYGDGEMMEVCEVFIFSEYGPMIDAVPRDKLPYYIATENNIINYCVKRRIESGKLLRELYQELKKEEYMTFGDE